MAPKKVDCRKDRHCPQSLRGRLACKSEGCSSNHSTSHLVLGRFSKRSEQVGPRDETQQVRGLETSRCGEQRVGRARNTSGHRLIELGSPAVDGSALPIGSPTLDLDTTPSWPQRPRTWQEPRLTTAEPSHSAPTVRCVPCPSIMACELARIPAWHRNRPVFMKLCSSPLLQVFRYCHDAQLEEADQELFDFNDMLKLGVSCVAGEPVVALVFRSAVDSCPPAAQGKHVTLTQTTSHKPRAQQTAKQSWEIHCRFADEVTEGL